MMQLVWKSMFARDDRTDDGFGFDGKNRMKGLKLITRYRIGGVIYSLGMGSSDEILTPTVSLQKPKKRAMRSLTHLRGSGKWCCEKIGKGQPFSRGLFLVLRGFIMLTK